MPVIQAASMTMPITGNSQLPVPPVWGRSKPRVLMIVNGASAWPEVPLALILTAFPSTVHSCGSGRTVLRDDHLHGSLEQRIGAVRLNLGQRVGIVLQSLDRQLARRGRHKVGGTVCLCRLAGHIPHILRGIEGASEIVVVRTVLDQELDLRSVATSIGEVLGHVHTEAVDSCIVGQRVIEAGVAALPGQGDFVGIASIAEDEGVIRVQRGPIGDAQGAVAVSAVDRGGSAR